MITIDTVEVGILIDEWKLDIFKRHLTKEGFAYDVHPEFHKGTVFLCVYANAVSVGPTVKRAQAEAYWGQEP